MGLAIGGFSQGAAAALASATGCQQILETQLAGLFLLAPPALKAPLPKESLKGTTTFVTGGDEDTVNPISGCKDLHKKCGDAGAALEPFLQYAGGHAVTMEVVDALSELLERFL